jgi:hypothetical protein
LFLFRGRATAEDVDVDIVRQRRRAGEGQAGDDRKDGGEGDRGNESEERLAADRLCEQRGRHVAARIHGGDRLLPHEHHGAEAEHERQQVKRADDRRGVRHGHAGCAGVGDRVEAHQDVR